MVLASTAFHIFLAKEPELNTYIKTCFETDSRVNAPEIFID
jgi:hypothetical protein